MIGSPNKTNDYFYSLFKTARAREMAKEINDYLTKDSPFNDEVEDYHDKFKNGVRTDCIGYVSSQCKYKFATMTMARKVCFVLHLGAKLHKNNAVAMQNEIDKMLKRNYKDTDHTKLTPGEVYVRLEWIDNLDQIKPFINEAYYLRLKK
ncbi:hypothetical protein [Bacillus sp. AFS096315]|uniref:hypothetical protein n=1 Tax=Bacillus sp. AFS096315 TaxID=2033517 RepID=UPI000BEB935A|nr:hypothetical protein [Bacillus sp. AFS096315]PEC50295.1 hypothetical protein CON00_07015 [Bacillus sp. AFS096315]